MPQRIEIDPAASAGRQTIDAGWSPKKKAVVGSTAGGIAVVAVIAGIVAMVSAAPPSLPTSAEEVIQVVGSGKLDRLDEVRRRQYIAESMTLLRDLSDDERRALFENEEDREAMRELREEMFNERARQFARGEVDSPFPPRGQRPPRRNNDDGNGEQREPPTEEEREQRQNDRRERIREGFANAVQSGNAQNTGLRGEMFKRMFQDGFRPGARGGGRPRGGGGGGNGGGNRN